jgi:cholesterol oxidase
MEAFRAEDPSHVERDYDAVVVGSGFGGSVTAFRLADAGLHVAVLERGKPYAPGSFPRSPQAMSKNFWDPSEGLYGLYDLWRFRNLEALVSSGLGGGSLIYANVLLRKDERWFIKEPLPGGGYEDWPVTRAELDPHYDRVEQMIGVQRYPIERAPYRETRKTLAFRQAAESLGLDWYLAPLGVTFANADHEPVRGEQIKEQVPSLHRLPRSTCQLVSECDIGCNFGSKNSMDHTYLSAAQATGRADINPRCEVRSFQPISGGFSVDYVEHSPDREGKKTDTSQLPIKRVRCRRLILSAGALGTTYLLLKNREELPQLSGMLGGRFSSNGDFLGFLIRARRVSNGKRKPLILDPSFGPVIASTVRVSDQVDGGDGRGFYIQDAGYPQLLNWMVEEGLPGQSLRLARFLARRVWSYVTKSPKSEVGLEIAKLTGTARLTTTSMPLLGMGRDVPDGWLRLRRSWLDVDWSPKASRTYFKRVNAMMRSLAHEMGAIYLTNPIWWLNLLITVHPVGGAPMGRTPREGVVDPYGRVFGYEDRLSVADGSVMPGPVGPNPSLTIAALADRFADRILEDWPRTG